MSLFGLFGRRGGKILIVEDEPDIAEGMKAFLDSEGYAVTTADDGAKGVKMALEGKFALIVLDLNLPKFDGFTVCRMLRQDPRTAAVPVLVLTALQMIGDAEKAITAGANAYMTKPYMNDRLLAKIKKLLGQDGAG